jgi:hypothetical protein
VVEVLQMRSLLLQVKRRRRSCLLLTLMHRRHQLQSL